MKAELDELFNKLEIRTIDLGIDSHVDELCKVTNQTSSLTRRSLYFSIIVSIFALVIVLNTRHYSWTDARLQDIDVIFKKSYDSLVNDAEKSVKQAFLDTNYYQSFGLLNTKLDSLSNLNFNKEKSNEIKQEIIN